MAGKGELGVAATMATKPMLPADAQRARSLERASGWGRAGAARMCIESSAGASPARSPTSRVARDRNGNATTGALRAVPTGSVAAVGYLEITDAAFALPGGWVLFEGVTFRVPEGAHTGLVGANGIGKSTLLRIVAGEERATAGQIRVDGRVGFMHQFIGSDARPTTVRGFLLAYAEPEVRAAAARLEEAEARLAQDPDERAQLRYAEALTAWESAGGYRAEVRWDRAAHIAFGGGYPESAERHIETLSGGERKRLALEAVLGGPFDVLLLDEPDNTLDIQGKEWLEAAIASDPRTFLFVSHDRTVLDRAATQIVTMEGRAAWTHPAGFATYAEARDARIERLDERHRRFEEERKRLADMVKEMKRKAAYNDGWASKARSAEHRLERFQDREEPPDSAEVQDVRMRVDGGRTGKVAFRARGLAIAGIVAPFDAEFRFGERVGIVGPNGTGKTHFLRLLAGEPIAHEGEWMLGARVEPALFAQLHERPDIGEQPIMDVLLRRGLDRTRTMSALRRYELDHVWHEPLRAALGRAAGAVPDPVDGARLAHDAPARRADGQPRRGIRRRVGGGARSLRGTVVGGDARPVAHARCSTGSCSSTTTARSRELLESPTAWRCGDGGGPAAGRGAPHRWPHDPRAPRPPDRRWGALGDPRSERRGQDDAAVVARRLAAALARDGRDPGRAAGPHGRPCAPPSDRPREPSRG